jgi:hypothetical protein
VYVGLNYDTSVIRIVTFGAILTMQCPPLRTVRGLSPTGKNFHGILNHGLRKIPMTDWSEILTLKEVRDEIAELGFSETRARWLEAIDTILSVPASMTSAASEGWNEGKPYFDETRTRWPAQCYEFERALKRALNIRTWRP